MNYSTSLEFMAAQITITIDVTIPVKEGGIIRKLRNDFKPSTFLYIKYRLKEKLSELKKKHGLLSLKIVKESDIDYLEIQGAAANVLSVETELKQIVDSLVFFEPSSRPFTRPTWEFWRLEQQRIHRKRLPFAINLLPNRKDEALAIIAVADEKSINEAKTYITKLINDFKESPGIEYTKEQIEAVNEYTKNLKKEITSDDVVVCIDKKQGKIFLAGIDPNLGKWYENFQKKFAQNLESVTDKQ